MNVITRYFLLAAALFFASTLCAQVTPMTFRDTIPADSLPYIVCLDTSELAGVADTIFNACPGSSGEFVHFYFDEEHFCVKYEGLKCGGEETACVVICDSGGDCDTTYVAIFVDMSTCMRTSQKMTDTILINFSNTICVDTTQLPGAIASVENICPDESGQSVVFEYDEATNCIEYMGIGQGLDMACFLLTDVFGNQDTVNACVYVRLPETGIIIDTILLGQSETYCFDNTELAGNLISILNFCPALSGNEVTFAVNPVTLCLDAFGIAIGTDTACIQICDSYGVCDTTYVLVTVVPDGFVDPCANALPPTAVADSATTLVNTPVVIDILANDSLGNCLPVTVTILDTGTGGTGPLHGLTALQTDQTAFYVPDQDFCGMDTFQYVLCNAAGCDTTDVVVKIACVAWDTIIIYNAISPNDDGTNDFFTIENIGHYPDNELKVFNRWGNQVYSATGYKNQWDGRYQNAMLPDGTYFYQLQLTEELVYTGYFQVHR